MKFKIVIAIGFEATCWAGKKPKIHYSTRVAANSDNSPTISYQQLLNLNITKSDFIPRIIFRTAKFDYYSIPYEIKSWVLDHAIENNPSYIQVYFNDDDCLDFIQRYYPVALNAYNVLIPGTFKADLFRYCVLDYYGGIYMDLNLSLMKNLNDIVRPFDSFVSVMDPTAGMYIYSGFIACKKGHPLMKIILYKIIDNVSRLSYGDNFLDITGPAVAGKGFNAFFGRHVNTTIQSGHYNLKGPSEVNYYNVRVLSFEWEEKRKRIYERRKNNVCMLYRATPHYFELMFNLDKDKHYKIRWLEKDVFNLSFVHK